MWLLAVVLDSVNLEHFHHHRNLFVSADLEAKEELMYFKVFGEVDSPNCFLWKNVFSSWGILSNLKFPVLFYFSLVVAPSGVFSVVSPCNHEIKYDLSPKALKYFGNFCGYMHFSREEICSFHMFSKRSIIEKGEELLFHRNLYVIKTGLWSISIFTPSIKINHVTFPWAFLCFTSLFMWNNNNNRLHLIWHSLYTMFSLTLPIILSFYCYSHLRDDKPKA